MRKLLMNPIIMIIGVLVMILAYSLIFNACGGKYRGDHPDLYSVAIHNFPGAWGYSGNGEISGQPPDVEVIEKDSYGRTLFYYHEGINDYGCGYGIMQKSQDGHVYYYEYDCVLHAENAGTSSGKVQHDGWFTEEEINAFKADNDWDQPINEEKCTKAEIVTRKAEAKLKLKDDNIEKVMGTYISMKQMAEEGNKVIISRADAYGTYFTSDDYGREMYFVRRSTPTAYYIFIFNPDGTCDASKAVAEIEDLNYFGDVLRELQQQVGWNTEYRSR